MAVYVYRGDEEALIEANRLGIHLDAGWSIEKEKPKKAKIKKVVEAHSDSVKLDIPKFGAEDILNADTTS